MCVHEREREREREERESKSIRAVTGLIRMFKGGSVLITATHTHTHTLPPDRKGDFCPRKKERKEERKKEAEAERQAEQRELNYRKRNKDRGQKKKTT